MDVEEHARAGTDVVDGLRGFAILVVVAYHLWLFSWYTPPPPADVFARTGYLGVDLFFLISGFCLFFPYARHVVEGTSRPTARTFFYRRFLKIVPSYALALVVTAALAAPTLARPSDAIGPFFTHAFFANNFFNDAFGKTNSVLWSLGIEVQFYLIFPLLAIVFMARPVLTAVAMIAIALVFRHATAGCCLAWETTIRQLPAFLDLFALGMFVAYAYVFARARLPWTRGAKIYFILAAMVLGLIAFAMLRGANGVQYIPSGRETWNVDGRTLLG
ncbi:MAG: acyltransferase, partial [Candidatus Eremiobacteraeota bacterium]|nr:acyltransferase [Candidatus Eremiobacteraeota bacterium]